MSATPIVRGLVLLGVCLACRAEPMQAPTPAPTLAPTLAPDGTLAFSETDLQGRPVRRMLVALTDEPGTTCRGDGWKRVRILDDSGGRVSNPVYKEGEGGAGKVEILLVSDICDGYDAYVGQVRRGWFTGEHVRYGWGSKTVGRVTGTYLAQ